MSDQIIRKKVEHNERTFEIEYNGEDFKTLEIVQSRDKQGNVTTEKVWRDRQPMVKTRALRNQDYDAIEGMWWRKYKQHDEKVREGQGLCVSCGAKMEVWRHTRDNDDTQTREIYLYRHCPDCGADKVIRNSDQKIPYDELDE